MTRTYLIVFLTVLAVCPEVTSQLAQRCRHYLANIINDGTAPCTALRNFSKCVYGELELDLTTLTETEKQSIQDRMNKELIKHGVWCDIDVRQIIEEISRDRRKGIVHTTETPKGYHDAATVGDCFNTFIIQTDKLTCSSITPYLKCLHRVTDFSKKFTESDFRAFKHSLEALLAKHGVYCSINIKELIGEINKVERWQVYTTVRPVLEDNTEIHRTTRIVVKAETIVPKPTERGEGRVSVPNMARGQRVKTLPDEVRTDTNKHVGNKYFRQQDDTDKYIKQVEDLEKYLKQQKETDKYIMEQMDKDRQMEERVDQIRRMLQSDRPPPRSKANETDKNVFLLCLLTVFSLFYLL